MQPPCTTLCAPGAHSMLACMHTTHQPTWETHGSSHGRGSKPLPYMTLPLALVTCSMWWSRPWQRERLPGLPGPARRPAAGWEPVAPCCRRKPPARPLRWTLRGGVTNLVGTAGHLKTTCMPLLWEARQGPTTGGLAYPGAGERWLALVRKRQAPVTYTL